MERQFNGAAKNETVLNCYNSLINQVNKTEKIIIRNEITEWKKEGQNTTLTMHLS